MSEVRMPDQMASPYYGDDKPTMDAFQRLRKNQQIVANAVINLVTQVGGAGMPVDTQNNGVVAEAGITFINIPTTNGSTTVLQFVANTTGADLKLKPGTIQGQILIWDHANTRWIIDVLPGATMDYDNATVLAKANPTFANIPATNGSTTILEFAANGAGVDLQLKASGSAGKVIRSNGSAWIIDYPILH